MHKIAAKEFTLEDFSHDHMIPNSCILLEYTINMLNELRAWYLKWDYMKVKDRENFDQNIHDKKDLWWQMIQLLPSSYNQTRNVMMNYEVLANIYKSRKNHKLDEWREFCSWIESLPYSELITGAAGSLEARRIFSEPFPWTKEAGERLKAEMDGIIKAAVDKELHNTIIPDSSPNSFSMKDLEEAMEHYDPNNGVKTHVTMMKED